MFWVLAYDVECSFPAHDFAILTYELDGCSDFHKKYHLLRYTILPFVLS